MKISIVDSVRFLVTSGSSIISVIHDFIFNELIFKALRNIPIFVVSRKIETQYIPYSVLLRNYLGITSTVPMTHPDSNSNSKSRLLIWNAGPYSNLYVDKIQGTQLFSHSSKFHNFFWSNQFCCQLYLQPRKLGRIRILLHSFLTKYKFVLDIRL